MIMGWGPFSIFVYLHKKLYRDENEYIYEFILPENQITDDKWMTFLELAQL